MLHSMLAQLILAAEEGAEETGSGADLLKYDLNEFLAGLIAFAIIAFVVWKFAFPALNEALEKRQQAITGQLKEAEDAKSEAESLLGDYKAQLADAKSEGERIIDDARQTAEAMRADILARAQAEADEVRRKAQADAAAERERAGDALRGEVATLSLDVAEKVLAGAIDREGQRVLVDRYIAELGGIGQ